MLKTGLIFKNLSRHKQVIFSDEADEWHIDVDIKNQKILTLPRYLSHPKWDDVFAQLPEQSIALHWHEIRTNDIQKEDTEKNTKF